MATLFIRSGQCTAGTCVGVVIRARICWWVQCGMGVCLASGARSTGDSFACCRANGSGVAGCGPNGVKVTVGSMYMPEWRDNLDPFTGRNVRQLTNSKVTCAKGDRYLRSFVDTTPTHSAMIEVATDIHPSHPIASSDLYLESNRLEQRLSRRLG